MTATQVREAGLRNPAARRALGIGLAVAAGAASALQSRINGELGVRLGDGIAAATVSFGVGLLLLAPLAAGTPRGRRGVAAVWAALRGRALRPWQLLGGACGALLVTAQGVTVQALGVAVFTVAVVAGQTASGLVVDRAGIGPGGAQPVTARRLVGAGLTVAAVLLAVGQRLGQPTQLALAALPALAGITLAWQQAVNGRVRVAAGSTLAATLVNFVVGTAALLVAYAVDVAARGWPAGRLPTEPWLYLGGVLGAVLIAVAAAVVPLIGVLLLGLAIIAGQVAGAVLLDVIAPPAAGPPGLSTVLGAALTLVAVTIAAVRGR